MHSASHILAIFNFGTTELILIFAVILLLFGGAKLPSLAKGLGQSIREFKKASSHEDAATEDEEKGTEKKKTPSKPDSAE